MEVSGWAQISTAFSRIQIPLHPPNLRLRGPRYIGTFQGIGNPLEFAGNQKKILHSSTLCSNCRIDWATPLPVDDFPFIWRNSPLWTMVSSLTNFLDRSTTVGRTLDESSTRRKAHTQHSQQTRHPCLQVGFEPANSAGDRQQTHTLEHAATGTCFSMILDSINSYNHILTL